MYHKEIVAKNIQAARNKRDFTQEELAHRAHISVRMLRKIELGQSNPSVRVLYSICLALGVTLDEATQFPLQRPQAAAAPR